MRLVRTIFGVSQASSEDSASDSGTISDMDHNSSATAAQQEVGLYFTATLAQREALRAEAEDLGLSTRELLEQKVFGTVRPRQRKRRRGHQQDTLQLDVA